jgi:glycosyltransferase involved in cell wall biosynthesis
MLRSTVATVLHTLGHAAADRAKETVRRATLRERRLRIGVDIRPFYEPLTGVGWYLYFILHELAKRDGVDLYLFGDARVTDEGPLLHAGIPAGAHLCTFDLRGRGRISRAGRQLTAATYILWMEEIGCDVFLGANYFLPRLLDAVARRRVITVHDLTYKRYPDLLQRETLHNLEVHMAREIARSDAIICVSESTRRDLLHYNEVDPSRVVAIHSGLGRVAEPIPVEGLPPHYILFVSTIEPRKNLGVLLDAYARLRQSGAYDGSLVVVGRVGWKSEEIMDRLRAPGVVHLDYLEPRRLAEVYRRADAFALPSLYEGFGFPLLEAMAHGVPTVAARTSSLPEIGGDATLYFDPHDPGELATQLDRAIHDSDLRRTLIARGAERIKEFRWERAGEQTLAVLRRAAE